ncbi:MAG TPA: hypothetical protein VHO70_22395 [Chitinispirillaceae bacterium]|nr:hypothetical protein [Chitinispirillaceae bacterium]
MSAKTEDETVFYRNNVMPDRYTIDDTPLSRDRKRFRCKTVPQGVFDENNVCSEFKESLKRIIFLAAGRMIDEYCEFSRTNLKTDPEIDQVAYEVLSIGVLWCNYSSASQVSSKIALSALQFIDKESEKLHWLKVAIDPIRGVLSTLFLSPYFHPATYASTAIDYTSFLKLIVWLDAVGDYKNEVRLFSDWKKFFETKTPSIIEEYLRKAVFIGQWFEIHSRKAFSPFIQNISESGTAGRYVEQDIERILTKSRKETENVLRLIAVNN